MIMKYRILIAMLVIVSMGVGCECAMGQGWVRQNDFYGDDYVKFYVNNDLKLSLNFNSADFFENIILPKGRVVYWEDDTGIEEDGGSLYIPPIAVSTDRICFNAEGDIHFIGTGRVPSITADGGIIDFDNENLTTTGYVEAAEYRGGSAGKLKEDTWFSGIEDDICYEKVASDYDGANAWVTRACITSKVDTIEHKAKHLINHAYSVTQPTKTVEMTDLFAITNHTLDQFFSVDTVGGTLKIAEHVAGVGGPFDLYIQGTNDSRCLLHTESASGLFRVSGHITLDGKNTAYGSPGIQVLGKLKFGQTDGNESIESEADGYVNYDATVAHVFDTGDVNIVGGTLCFVDPNGGMIEGEMSGYNEGITLTSVAQGDWDKIAAFTVNGPSNVIDPNHIDDHIHITKDGRYACRWRWSGHGTAVAHDWEFLASKNNNAVMFTNTASIFTNPTTQKDVTVPGGGTILCEVGDELELWVKRKTPGNNIILTTDICWLYVRLTGGL